MSNLALNPYGIAVYVNGYGKGYESNPGWAPGGTYSYVDDLGFINALITNLTSTFCVDTGRIFAVGHSNGGGFCGVLACDPVLSVKIAAFAANSGAFYTAFTTGDPLTIEPVNTPVQSLCSPGRNTVPFIEFHGTADTQIRYMGDTTHNGRILPSLPHWSTAWSVREGYGMYNYSTVPGSNINKYEFGGGNGQLGIITHYMLTGWVHAWASVSAGAPMDAAPPIMDFFYRWSDPNRAPLNDNVSRPTSSSTSSSTSTVSTVSTTSSAISTTTTSSMSSTSSSSSSMFSSSSPSSTTSMSTGSSSSKHNSSSQSSSSSSAAPYVHPGFTCPGANGQMYTDPMGIQYYIACHANTNQGNYGAFDVLASGSFDDCFYECSSNYQSTTNCTAFTYYSPTMANGLGPGTCFLKNLSPVSFTSADNNQVAAIRMQYYAAGGYDPVANAVTTTTTTSSSSSSSSSASQSSSASSSQGSSFSSSSVASAVQSTSSSSSASPSSSSTQASSSTHSSGVTSTAPLSGSSASAASTVSSSVSASIPSTSAVCHNNTVVSDANSINYTIYCDADTDNSGGGPFATQTFNSGDFMTCANACDSTDGCGAFVWMPFVNPGGTCYMKHAPQDPTAGNSGYVVGIKVSAASSSMAGTSTVSATGSSTMVQTSITSSPPSATHTSSGPQCPSANGTTYTDPSGAQYMVLCDKDTTPGNFGTAVEADFGTCIDACHTQTDQQCVAVSYALGTCYFKAQYYGSLSSPGTEAAVLLSALGISSGSGSSSSSSATVNSHLTITILPTSSTMAISSSAMNSASSSAMSSASSSAMNGASSNAMNSASSNAMSSASSSATNGASSSAMNGASSSTMNGVSSSAMNSASSSASMQGSASGVSASSSIAQNPTTYTISGSTSSDSVNAASSTSTLPSCSTQTGQAQSSGNTTCADAYGNTFNVTTGRAYTGTITLRAVRPNLGSCLTACDSTPGCVAINYIGTECQLLSEVTGTTTVVGGGGAAATRPPDVSTVYTAPPSTSATATTSNGASGATSANGGGSASVGASSGGVPASPGMSTVAMTGQPGGSSPGIPGETSYLSSGANAPMTQASMANPSQSMSSSGGAGGGGAGPVSGGGNNGITSGMMTGTTGQGSINGGGAPGGASATGSINTVNNAGGGSITGSSSNPANTGAVCPSHDNEQYTNPDGSNYNIQCNSTFSGTILTPSNSTSPMHKRQASGATFGSCMNECDQYSACVAIVLDCTGTCSLLSSVSGTIDGACGVGAVKSAGPNHTGSGDIVTVSVCATVKMGTTTMFTTATLTTCAADAKCTGSAEKWRANPLIGEEDIDPWV